MKLNIKIALYTTGLVLALYAIPTKETITIAQVKPEPPDKTVLVIKQVNIPNYTISYDMDLTEPTNITAEDLEKAFKNTKMAGLGQYFVKAEKEYGVNAIYLAGLGCLESAWGTSGYATKRNNLFGWQAYDRNPDLAKDFDTKEEAILTVAKALKKNYLTKGGAYHNGVTMASISKRYASDPQHSNKIFSIMKTLVNRMEVK